MENNVSIITLKAFQNVPMIDFGETIVGVPNTHFITLLNEFHETFCANVVKFPKNNFTKLHKGKPLEDAFIIEPKQEFKFELTWSPTSTGRMFDVMSIQINSIYISIKCIGYSKNPKLVKKIILDRKKVSFDEIDKENIDPRKYINGNEIVESKPLSLLYSKNNSHLIKRYSTSDTVYSLTEKWLLQQEIQFAEAINRILLSSRPSSRLSEIIENFPELLNLAKQYYECDEIINTIARVKEELDKKPFIFKKETYFRDGTVFFKHMTDLVRKYNDLWLFLALQVVLKVKPDLDLTNIETLEQQIKQFNFQTIKDYLLWSDRLARKHKITKQNRQPKEAMEKDLNRFVLIKFVEIVYFLDRIKMCRRDILPSDISLFRSKRITTSIDILNEFTKLFICGEGNIAKKLTKWGCTFEYSKELLADYNFTIKDLQFDLRDGVRLAYLAKMLNISDKSEDILTQLRYPVDDLARKTHNIKVVLDVFRNAGTNLVTYNGYPIEPYSIAYGNRDKTLSLLWCIFSQHCVDEVVESNKLITEILIHTFDKSIDVNLLRNQLSKLNGTELLLTWISQVCLLYNLSINCRIDNLRDGRALCLLMYRYFPHIINLTTINSYQNNYCSLFYSLLSKLGGVPIALPTVNESNKAPADKIILAILAYFSSRLDLMLSMKSAVIIQKCWIKFRSSSLMLNYYVKYLPSVITCQAVIRGYIARRRYYKLRSKTVLIQSQVRGYLTRKHYRKMRNSVVKLQNHWRMYRARQAFKQTKRSIVILQSYARMMITRRKYLASKQAAEIIQKFIRMFLCRRQFVKQKFAVLTIEQHYIAYVEQRDFIQLRNATLTFQANYRSLIQRRRFIQIKSAVLTIQTWIRCKLAERYFILMKLSVVTLQKTIRGWTQRKKYNKLKLTTIYVQSLVRRKLCRYKFNEMKHSVIILQKNWRRYNAQHHYMKLKQSSILIQKIWRGYSVRTQMKIANQAALVIEKNFRRFVARRDFVKLRSSTIVIQKRVRMVQAKIKYRRIIGSIINCQSCIRRFIAVKKYQRIRDSCVIIQKMYRCYLAWKEYQNLRMTTVFTQSCIRRFLAVKSYEKIMRSTIVLQKYWRGYSVRVEYLELKRSTIKIQSLTRGYLVRKQLSIMHKSAVIIQKNCRSYLCQKAYQKRYKSVIVIQSLIRRHLVMKNYKIMLNGFIILQALVRKNIAQNHFKLQLKSALIIQKNYRRFKCQKSYEFSLKAVVIIQKNIKMFLTRNSYVKQKQSAIIIQKNVRMFLLRKKFQILKNSAILLQKNYRCFRLQRLYQKQRESCIVIQKYFRSYIARARFVEIKNSAILIQSWIRMSFVQREFIRKRNSCIIIQKHFRRWLTMKQIKIMNEKSVLIQSWWRMVLQKRKYHKLQSSVFVIQKNFKMIMDRRRFRELRHKMVLIQSLFRGWIQRRIFKTQLSAIVKIQSVFRCLRERIHYKRMYNSSIIIQKHVRTMIAQKQYQNRLKFIVDLQSLSRRYLTIKSSEIKMKAIVYLQSQIRGYIARKKYRSTLARIVTVQANVRRFICQQRYAKIKWLASNLGRYCQGYLTRYKFEEAKFEMIESRIQLLESREHGALLIQNNWRRYLAVKKYKNSRMIIIKIQRQWKLRYAIKCRSANIIGLAWIKFKRTCAAKTIQRIWRGYSTRLELDRLPTIDRKLRMIRARFIKALNDFKPSNTMSALGNKAWLELQQKTQTVPDPKNPSTTYVICTSDITNCLMVLDKVTRLSREMCHRLTETSALYQLLMSLIKHCNRGESDLYIVSYTVSILTNLCRAKVINMQHIVKEVGKTLLSLMKHNLNSCKGGQGVSVFCHCGLFMVLLVKQQFKYVQLTHGENNSCYMLRSDATIKKEIREMRRNLYTKYQNSDNNFSQQIVEQLSLSPYWDLSRDKNPPTSIEQLIKSRNHLIKDNKGQFKKPLINALSNTSRYNKTTSKSTMDLKRMGAGGGSITQHRAKISSQWSVKSISPTKTSVNSNINIKKKTKQPSVSASVSREQIKDFEVKPNPWDLTHKLYAICLLFNELDYDDYGN